MKFTDIFIHRPVLASVISLMILVIGLRALTALDVRQYPETKNTVVTVTTTYPGASSELIKGFITTPLQQAIAQADGIDYLFARSTQGSSTIEAHMELNRDPNAAVADIQAKVASQRSLLPVEAEDPVIDSTTGDSTALMYMAFYSDNMKPSQITDYLIRVVQPKLQAIPGVAKAGLIGNRIFALRVWLDPERMAALKVSPSAVREVLKENNFLSAVGQTKGEYVITDLSAETNISSEADFRRLVVRSKNGTLVRLEDISKVELGSEDYDSTNRYKNKTAIFIGIQPAPGANPLTVAKLIHDALPDIRGQLPEGLNGFIPYDASVFIQDSIDEVFKTLLEAVLIVLIVIFLSLGSIRAALIPAVAVPLSLIGGAFVMLAFGYSINLLTLLAMVLSIGLVVDDAIIVVENIHRHIEEGATKMHAALQGARELAMPVIAMTTTLVAVYAPFAFMEGLVGTLFIEFAFTLAGAVVVSGVVALTLSPMLSAKVLKTHGQAGRFELLVERFFTGLANGYQRLLHSILDTVSIMVVFAVVVLVSIYFMFVSTPSALAPTEDQSILFFQARSPQTATLEYNEAYADKIQDAFETIPEYHESFYLLGFGRDTSTVFGGFKMDSPSTRPRSQMEIQPELQQKLSQIAGFKIAVFPRPSLPGSGGGLPIGFVITSDADYARMDEVADDLIAAGMQSGKFIFLQKSVEFSRPKTTLLIDRNLAADLGITMKDIGSHLSTMLGGSFVNRFSLDGRSYKVIPQVSRDFRADTDALNYYYIPTASGEQIPLSTLVSFESTVEPSQRTQFQQLNSNMIQGVMAPGVQLGDALAFMENHAREQFPKGFSWDYSGQSRQYTQQGSALIVTFFMSVLVIYLVLAAQFESWRDPFIVLVSVPMSIAGALIFMTLGFASVNIYTQVGLITLIGLIAKNGILIVEFANQLQEHEGLSKRNAVEKASAIRLRPILMTTVAMVVAMVPLLLASGPGAASRFAIGLVIATGLGIGTIFTLFVVPAMYVLLARDRSEHSARTGAGVKLPDPQS